jgi:hypothetical protein
MDAWMDQIVELKSQPINMDGLLVSVMYGVTFGQRARRPTGPDVQD